MFFLLKSGKINPFYFDQILYGRTFLSQGWWGHQSFVVNLCLSTNCQFPFCPRCFLFSDFFLNLALDFFLYFKNPVVFAFHSFPERQQEQKYLILCLFQKKHKRSWEGIETPLVESIGWVSPRGGSGSPSHNYPYPLFIIPHVWPLWQFCFRFHVCVEHDFCYFETYLYYRALFLK